MTKLTDSQLIILSAAAQRESGTVLPLPKSCKLNQGAAAIVLKSLIKKKLIAERPAAAGDETWRLAKDGGRFTLMITTAGNTAIGNEPDVVLASGSMKESKSSRAKSKASQPKAKTEPQTEGREGTKQAALIDLLKRKSGATIAEAVEATGWQKHSVRGAISGTLKKKLGLAVTSATVEGRGRVYHIANR